MSKLNFKILLFINIIVNGIKDKKMRGNVIERKLVETPKKSPESIIKNNKLLFCVMTFIEKYMKKIKKKRNIVSDKSCEDNIIIKGESAANPYKKNLYLGTIKLAIL